MTGVFVALLEVCACTGLGAAALRALRIDDRLSWGERTCWSLAIGIGLLGWLLFFLGIGGLFNGPILLAVLIISLAGIGLLGMPPTLRMETELTWVGRLLAAGLAIAFLSDLTEALSPPADADSLAYHFALPKQFIAAGRIEFVPRAADGAVPLLVQMTYIPVLALGGETALTLWTLASGWGLAVLFYTLCRRHLNLEWSLAATLILMTLPAVVFGGGSGQVEVRIALFVLVAAMAVASALRTNLHQYAVLAGIAAGFYMASKYTGLFFVAACGLALLAGRGWLIRGAAFGAAALIAGAQWYGWNWYHSGDPVFPLLFGWLDYGDRGLWDAAHDAMFAQAFFEDEKAVDANLLWFALYPFKATLAGARQFESGRTGFGPYVLLALPFALAGAWRFRDRLWRSPLLTLALITAIYYALWFFVASSQRVRHLLPVLPLLLICVTVAARRWCDRPALVLPLVTVTALTIFIQSAGQSVFSTNYARHLLSGESRDQFFRRNIGDYPVVPWINRYLTRSDRVFVVLRNLVYLIDIPTYYGHAGDEALVDIRPEADDPARYFRQLRNQGVNHLLVSSDSGDNGSHTGRNQWKELVRKGCAETIETFTVPTFGSRTLPSLDRGEAKRSIVRLKGDACGD